MPMHDSTAYNPINADGPEGSVKIAPDGSMAALVPALRAMSWQLTNEDGDGDGIGGNAEAASNGGSGSGSFVTRQLSNQNHTEEPAVADINKGGHFNS